MADQYTPTSICNMALDAAGIDFVLGDIAEGTRPAQICRRHYSDCLRQLLRTAGWSFARKQSPLVLIADASGQTPNVGTLVPGNQFQYSYAYPTDCAFLRYIPWYPFFSPGAPSGNITPPDPNAPLLDNLQTSYIGQRVIPSRFVVTSDQNYIPVGTANDTAGVTPLGRTVILSNVPQAQGIYTYEALYPNAWDSQFRAALVAYIASEIALPLATDKKLGIGLRDRNMLIAMEKIKNARVSDGREGWHSSDIQVDWMRTRRSGGYGLWNNWNGMLGDWNCSYDSIGFANGSAY